MISEFVEYVKQVWKNKPNVSSPLNADRLNHMEAGIENNSKKIKETVTAVNELTEKKLQYKKFTKNVTATNTDNGWYYEIIDVSDSLPKGAILNNVSFDAGNWSANTILTVYDDQKFLYAASAPVNNSYRKFRLYYYI